MWEFRECSSCGALYTKSCACSKGGFIDKFVCDPNKTPYSSQRPPQDCPKCGNPVDGLYCRHCTLLRKKLKEHKFSKDFLNTFESSNEDFTAVSMLQEPVVFNQDPGPHETVQCQMMNYYKPNPCYDSNYFGFDNFQPSQPVIDHLNLQQRINNSMIELRGTFQAWLQQQKDQVCQKIPLCYDDDDDKESSTPLRDIIISELPLCIAITPVLSTKETKDSLIMGDELLDTILEIESDEFIKSSVENLVPDPSESEDERECNVPACDDFTTFSNLLFDTDDDFSSSDNESFFDEDIPKEIYSNPLFDKEIIFIKIDVSLEKSNKNVISLQISRSYQSKIMHPKRRSQTNPQPTLTQEAVDQLVRDGIKAAIRDERERVRMEATRAGGPTRGPAAAPMARECSFTRFMKCGPTQFHGSEGDVGLVRWFEKMENTFEISECAEEKKVKFAIATLYGGALTWWNSQVATLDREVANGRPWTEVKQMMTDEFCPTEEVQRLEDELRHLKLRDMNIAAYT
nr:putative zinc finger, CCHC-type, retrotransposon Gag domain protein [Tanacetum cinerariifolium]